MDFRGTSWERLRLYEVLCTAQEFPWDCLVEHSVCKRLGLRAWACLACYMTYRCVLRCVVHSLTGQNVSCPCGDDRRPNTYAINLDYTSSAILSAQKGYTNIGRKTCILACHRAIRWGGSKSF